MDSNGWRLASADPPLGDVEYKAKSAQREGGVRPIPLGCRLAGVGPLRSCRVQTLRGQSIIISIAWPMYAIPMLGSRYRPRSLSERISTLKLEGPDGITEGCRRVMRGIRTVVM